MAHPKPLQAALMATPDDTEAQFYEALQQADLERLMAVWADDDEIACVHPGSGRLVGSIAIRLSFQEILAQGPLDVRPVRVRRLSLPNCEIHHVLEQVRVETPTEVRLAHAITTNVYVKTPLGWRMVLHHASPGSDTELHESDTQPAVLH